MKKLRFTILTLLICLTLSSIVAANEKKTITWLIWELSPEFIRHGPYTGQGFADKFLQYFISELPEYEHRIQWTGIKRFHVEALKPQRCTPHIWKAFYLNKFEYSKAYTLTPPHIAIFHKKFAAELGPTNKLLSISQLLGEKKLKLITPALFLDQPRYPVLHKYLAPFANTPQIIELQDSSNEADLRLLGRRRADFALGYGTTITAQRRDRGLKGEFISYGLLEHQEYRDIHVSCLGDDFGKEVITKINTLLNKKTLHQFLAIYEEWNNSDARFRATFHAKFLN